MADGQRPGGLTALAVLNFVFGGLGAIGLMLLFHAIGAIDGASGGEVTRSATSSPGAAMAWLQLLLATATCVLLIVSGVGYLGQKRMMGRTMGNLYSIVSIASSAIGIVNTGFGIMSLVGLVYPVLTLLLINGTFKDDLVN